MRIRRRSILLGGIISNCYGQISILSTTTVPKRSYPTTTGSTAHLFDTRSTTTAPPTTSSAPQHSLTSVLKAAIIISTVLGVISIIAFGFVIHFYRCTDKTCSVCRRTALRTRSRLRPKRETPALQRRSELQSEHYQRTYPIISSDTSSSIKGSSFAYLSSRDAPRVASSVSLLQSFGPSRPRYSTSSSITSDRASITPSENSMAPIAQRTSLSSEDGSEFSSLKTGRGTSYISSITIPSFIAHDRSRSTSSAVRSSHNTAIVPSSKRSTVPSEIIPPVPAHPIPHIPATSTCKNAYPLPLLQPSKNSTSVDPITAPDDPSGSSDQAQLELESDVCAITQYPNTFHALAREALCVCEEEDLSSTRNCVGLVTLGSESRLVEVERSFVSAGSSSEVQISDEPPLEIQSPSSPSSSINSSRMSLRRAASYSSISSMTLNSYNSHSRSGSSTLLEVQDLTRYSTFELSPLLEQGQTLWYPHDPSRLLRPADVSRQSSINTHAASIAEHPVMEFPIPPGHRNSYIRRPLSSMSESEYSLRTNVTPLPSSPPGPLHVSSIARADLTARRPLPPIPIPLANTQKVPHSVNRRPKRRRALPSIPAGITKHDLDLLSSLARK